MKWGDSRHSTNVCVDGWNDTSRPAGSSFNSEPPLLWAVLAHAGQPSNTNAVAADTLSWGYDVIRSGKMGCKTQEHLWDLFENAASCGGNMSLHGHDFKLGQNESRTWDSRHKSQRSEHPERSQSLHVQTAGFSCSVMSFSWFVVCHGLGDDAEQPVQHTIVTSRERCRETDTSKSRTYPTMTMMKSSKFHPLRM